MFLSKSSVVNTIILIFLDRRFPFCETRLSVKIRKDRGKFSFPSSKIMRQNWKNNKQIDIRFRGLKTN